MLNNVETDAFDFKSDYKKLSSHLCAFANCSFGQMILGIGEDTTPKGYRKGFKRIGFPILEKDSIRNEINNAMINVEPNPSVRLEFLDDNNGKVYPIVQINGQNSNKPYFERGTGICHVRIGAATSPASRTTVLNLFSDVGRRIENVKRLSVSAALLQEMIKYACESLVEENPSSIFSRIIPFDSSLIKSCALDTEWFLQENNLYGGHIGNDSTQGGFHSFLYELELFNNDVHIYNTETFTKNRKEIKRCIDSSWTPGSSKHRSSLAFLDALITKARKFITDKESINR